MQIRINPGKLLEIFCGVILLILLIGIYAFLEMNSWFLIVELIFFITFGARFVLTKGKGLSAVFLSWNITFLFLCAASVLWSYDRSVAVRGVLSVLQMVLITNFMIPYLDSEKKINYVLFCYVAGAIALSVRLIAATPADVWGTARLGDAIGYNANAIGMDMTIAVLCAMHLIKCRKIGAIVLLPLIVGFMAIIFLTGSRKAFFMLIGGGILAILLSIQDRKKLKLAAPLLLISAVALISILLNIPEIYNVLGRRLEGLVGAFQGEGTADGSSLTRLEMIRVGIELIKQKPLMGHGLSNYAALSGFGAYSHNNYIEILVSTGIVGLLTYYAMYAYLFFRFCKIWIRKHLKHGIFAAFLIALAINEYGAVTYYSESIQLLLSVGFISLRYE